MNWRHREEQNLQNKRGNIRKQVARKDLKEILHYNIINKYHCNIINSSEATKHSAQTEKHNRDILRWKLWAKLGWPVERPWVWNLLLCKLNAILFTVTLPTYLSSERRLSLKRLFWTGHDCMLQIWMTIPPAVAEISLNKLCESLKL